MEHAIQFISTHLDLPPQQVEPYVQQYIDSTNKELLEFDDLRTIMNTIVMNGLNTNKTTQPTVQDDLEHYEFSIDDTETEKERNKNDNMIFIPLISILILTFILIFVSKIFKIHVWYMFGTIASVVSVYALIEVFTIRKKGD